MKKEALPDWSGKCISMMLIDESHSHDLNDPHFEYQGGRLFVVGTIPEIATDSGWSANQIGGVAWDRVRNYVLFENLESYVEGVRKSEAYEKENEESPNKANSADAKSGAAN